MWSEWYGFMSIILSDGHSFSEIQSEVVHQIIYNNSLYQSSISYLLRNIFKDWRLISNYSLRIQKIIESFMHLYLYFIRFSGFFRYKIWRCIYFLSFESCISRYIKYLYTIRWRLVISSLIFCMDHQSLYIISVI